VDTGDGCLDVGREGRVCGAMRSPVAQLGRPRKGMSAPVSVASALSRPQQPGLITIRTPAARDPRSVCDRTQVASRQGYGGDAGPDCRGTSPTGPAPHDTYAHLALESLACAIFSQAQAQQKFEVA